MSRSLFKSTSLVSLMTFLSRMLGFVRDTLAAQIYGADAMVDAFYVAFKIPNFMRGLFAEGSFSQAFVPVLADYRQRANHYDTQQFIQHLSGCLCSILSIITVLGVLAAPLLVMLFAPGYHPGTERFAAASHMLRITFPYLMLISLTAFCGAILNTYQRFGAPSFNPVLLNLCMIAAALFFSHYFAIPVEAQAWSVLLAGIAQLIFLLPFLKQIHLSVRPRWNWRDPGVRRVLRLMLPALFGASIGQISLLLNTIFASFLAVGSVTWLYYSDRLAYFPLGVFGVALATVVLPHLSTQHAKRSQQEFSAALDWGIRCNLLIGLPAAVTLMVLAGPLITSLFQYGKFTAFDVIMTRQSVIAYSFGLVSFMLVKVLSAGFYAQQDIKTPVRIGIIALTCNMLLNASLVFPLHHAGLALASSLASWINTALLWLGLHRKGAYRVQKGWYLFTGRLIIANFCIAGLMWYLAGDLTQWLNWHWQQRLIHVTELGIIAILSYVACLWLSGMRPSDFKMASAT